MRNVPEEVPGGLIDTVAVGVARIAERVKKIKNKLLTFVACFDMIRPQKKTMDNESNTMKNSDVKALANNKNRILCFLVVMVFAFSFVEAGGGSAFKVSGDISLDGSGGVAHLYYLKAIKSWRIVISAPRTVYKKTSRTGSINLFFSRKLKTVKAQKYPVAFSYLNQPGTFGGSFIYREKKKQTLMFSYDTAGEVTFTKTGSVLEGTFSFTVYDKGKDPRKKVTVTGTFSIPVKPGFPNAPPPQ